MSQFNFIYAEEHLSHREKAVYIYLRDRADASASAGRGSRPSPANWNSHPAPSSGRWETWNVRDWWRSTSVTEKTAASPATFIA